MVSPATPPLIAQLMGLVRPSDRVATKASEDPTSTVDPLGDTDTSMGGTTHHCFRSRFTLASRSSAEAYQFRNENVAPALKSRVAAISKKGSPGLGCHRSVASSFSVADMLGPPRS